MTVSTDWVENGNVSHDRFFERIFSALAVDVADDVCETVREIGNGSGVGKVEQVAGSFEGSVNTKKGSKPSN